MDQSDLKNNEDSAQTVTPKSWISKLLAPPKLENDATAISMETLETDVDQQSSGSTDKNISTTLALTRNLALMFEQPEEWKVAVTEDLTNVFESEKGHKEQLKYKRKLMLSLDSFDEDDTWYFGQNRFVTKKGFIHVNYVNMPGLKRKLAMDFFHTIMDAKWRYFTLMFFLSFLVTWIIFAGIWYGIFYARNGMICVAKVDSFVTAFLFSIETQITIGYGGRAVTDKCPEGVIVMIIQIVIGNFVNTALLGVLFAKLARPKKPRYVDLRGRKLLDSNMRLIIIKPHLTKEGEYIPLNMMDMSLTIDHGQVEYTMRLFPIYPVSIIHIIDEDSPLYELSKHELESRDFELIAILEGTVPGTGNCTEAIMSFKPSEVLWGQRFKTIFVGMKPGATSNCIDLSNLDKTYKEDVTPECSAKVYDGERSDRSSTSTSSSSSSTVSLKHPSFYITNLSTVNELSETTSRTSIDNNKKGEDLRNADDIVAEEMQ